MPHRNPTPLVDEQESAAAYIRAINKNITEKLQRVSDHKDAIAILRKELNRDIKARATVADRHGINPETT